MFLFCVLSTFCDKNTNSPSPVQFSCHQHDLAFILKALFISKHYDTKATNNHMESLWQGKRPLLPELKVNENRNEIPGVYHCIHFKYGHIDDRRKKRKIGDLVFATKRWICSSAICKFKYVLIRHVFRSNDADPADGHWLWNRQNPININHK